MLLKILSLGFAILTISSCATSIDGGSECEDKKDCTNGEVCNTLTKTCETIQVANNTKRDMGADQSSKQDMGAKKDLNVKPDSSKIDSGVEDTSDLTDMNKIDMNQPKKCTPKCGVGEKCDNGTCVESCNPKCVAPQTCTANGCTYPTCTKVDDKCETTQREQGNFFCIQGAGGTGKCLQKCPKFGAANCASGEYCTPISNVEGERACTASQCSKQSDCATGTCLLFDNDWGFCFPAGAFTENAICTLNVGECAPGLTCNFKVGSAAGEGTCQKVCQPWATTTGCSGGAKCANLSTPRSFTCSPDTDATGSQVYRSCTTNRAACGDALSCFPTATAHGCFKYCRPEANDCTGLTPASKCHNYIFSGEHRWGLCQPSCTNQVDCGTGSVCKDSICRTPCTSAATVINDCCAGNAQNCTYQCVAGLCE